MEQSRYANAIFCDDVRMEVGNKMSLMGIYQSQMIVPTLPVTIQKLCVFASATTDINTPFEKVEFTIKNNEDIIGKLIIDNDGIETQKIHITEKDEWESEQPTITAEAVLTIKQLIIDQPSRIEVLVETENEILRAGVLRILPKK